MSVLSNVDIVRELKKGKNIGIYPLIFSNIKGSTYNLTASKYAWSINTKKSLLEDDKIIIPPNDSALIATKEVIWISKKLCGSYHSKVSIVSTGGGHIGTTLDPDWSGHSLITVHNHSSIDNLEINVGSTFVSIMFHYLNKRSTAQQDNHVSQLNYLYKIIPSEHISTECSNYFEESWKSQSKSLITKMKTESDSEYDILVKHSKKGENGKNINLLIFYIVTGALLVLSLLGTFILEEKSTLQELSKYVAFVGFSGTFAITAKEVYEKLK